MTGTTTRTARETISQADDWPAITALGGPLSARLWEIADHGWQAFVLRNPDLLTDQPPHPRP